MRILLIQISLFALIFFLAALLMEQGHFPKVLLMTLAATAVYALLMGALRALGKKGRP